jgi:hypothetical protein
VGKDEEMWEGGGLVRLKNLARLFKVVNVFVGIRLCSLEESIRRFSEDDALASACRHKGERRGRGRKMMAGNGKKRETAGGG